MKKWPSLRELSFYKDESAIVGDSDFATGPGGLAAHCHTVCSSELQGA